MLNFECVLLVFSNSIGCTTVTDSTPLEFHLDSFMRLIPLPEQRTSQKMSYRSDPRMRRRAGSALVCNSLSPTTVTDPLSAHQVLLPQQRLGSSSSDDRLSRKPLAVSNRTRRCGTDETM